LTRTARRLPGIAINRVPAPTPQVLPRMDVVGFVGFAASGPLNVPVAIESYADFVAIFGGRVRLAWDPAAGRYAEAQLGPAIQAFFAGGGRRAHVVRVAGTDAERARHPVPGLLTVSDDKRPVAELVARAHGSWADALAVGAALTSELTVLTRLALGADGPELGLRGRVVVIRGDLLRVRAGTWIGYLPVRAVAAAPSGSPIGGVEQVVNVDQQRSLWLEPDVSPRGQLGWPDPAWSTLSPGDTVERLGLELWVRGELGQNWILTDLGFVPEHPRYLGSLPTDEEFFGPREPLRGAAPELWDAVDSPRFPLAAEPGNALYYPVGVDVVPETFLAAVTSDRPALERDGLGTYDDDLFLDDGMRDIGLETVLSTAEYLRWQAPLPRQLCGVHGFLDVDEVTILAVPDATQRPWRAEPSGPAPEPPPSPPDPTLPAGCRRPPFADCAQPDLGSAPHLSVIAGPDEVQLSWTSIPGPDVAYRLQVTTDPRGWDATRDIYVGNELSRSFRGGVSEHRFYRVRAESVTLHTQWSSSVAVVAHTAPRHVVEPANDYAEDQLLAIHRCLLRMCGARGDLLAVISLPEHYRAADAIAYADRLRSGADVASVVPPLDFGEQRALGFGAIYHPWVGSVLPDGTSGEVSWTPPDGALTGIIARHALARGAWVAPANEQLTGVVALRRHEPDDLLPALQTAQVNALQQTPDGFVCLAEDTLILDRELRPVNVRRLLALVRRLAAVEGTRYVFEPNDPTLRRAVERGFTDVLAFLFRLGAFAGRTAEQAFRVVVGDPPNTTQSIERGQLIIELKFAPAQPLEFLLVRLIQAGEHGFTLAVS
jgi:hypothetical protein